MNPTPLKTFIVYARDDKHHKDQLLRHLRPLAQNRYLTIWHDGDILPGEDWEKLIKTNLKASQLVLVLVSVNSLNSDFIQSEELATAVEQLKLGHTRIVPIIVAPCVWRYHNLFAGLQGLPEDMRPVVSWANTDEAWTNVVESLAGMVEEFRELEKKEQERLEQERLAREKRRREAQEAKRLERERQKNEKKAQEKQTAEKLEKAQLEKKRVEKQKTAEAKKRWQYEVAVGSAWYLAKKENTRKAYLNFAKMYSTHALAQEAEERARQIPHPAQIPRPAQMPSPRPIFKNYYLLGSGGLVTLALLLFLWISNSNQQPGKSNADQSPEPSPFEAEMVLVKGGIFQMGSNEYDAEKPIHTVTLPDFYIGKYEVTQKQWRDIMSSDPSELGFPGCDQCPVESVSWNDVQLFLQKLNAKYPGHNYRLPSEAEWEYAARGGQHSRGYNYAGSNNLEKVAWYGKNSGMKMHLVGGKKANELGLYDLSGNVWEWCADTWHNNYLGAPRDGSVWLKGGNKEGRVLRGGAWFNEDDYCRSDYRAWNSSRSSEDYYGFRLARHL